MPVISNSNVTVTKQGSSAIATITWQTDVPCDSSVGYGQGSVPGTPSATILDGSFVTSHVVVISGLSTDTDYFAILGGTDERGQPCTCDVVSPGSNCAVLFRTPNNSGPATSLSATAVPDRIDLGQTSQLQISTIPSGGGAGAPDRDVNFNIHNGGDRGSFSDNPAKTGANGTVNVTFTSLKRGKAQIQVTVDTLSRNVDVIVN